tara:strand:- start:147 stop:434 length:288 start_codon:yes stop_codon:yes gene_type:complete
MTLTTFETKFVENMISNCFGDAPDHIIWTDCWMDGKHGKFIEDNQVGGVMSSLIQKGIIAATTDQWDSFNTRNDNTCWFTTKGQAFLNLEEEDWK